VGKMTIPGPATPFCLLGDLKHHLRGTEGNQANLTSCALA
jgi:hypothetical protein